MHLQDKKPKNGRINVLTLFTLGGRWGGGVVKLPPAPMMIFFNYSETANAAELKFPDF